jgi:hypothetical protein
MAALILQQPFLALFVDQLDPETLSTFRLCSRYCTSASEPAFYRKLAIRDAGNHDDYDPFAIPGAQSTIESILGRIEDDQDKIRFYVRHLKIGPFVQDAISSYLSTNGIVHLVSLLPNLRHLRYLLIS